MGDGSSVGSVPSDGSGAAVPIGLGDRMPPSGSGVTSSPGSTVPPSPLTLAKSSSLSPPKITAPMPPRAPTATTPATIRPIVLPRLDEKNPPDPPGAVGAGPTGTPPCG